jgi:hypothetical protein
VRTAGPRTPYNHLASRRINHVPCLGVRWFYITALWSQVWLEMAAETRTDEARAKRLKGRQEVALIMDLADAQPLTNL